ncbi:hypothetical protein [Caldalkalibacillus mannanilyticus]|uniref:hypothetical protein n=1 Tax=Caldalkalibacillus mannanilyticus TaxID=1418 RepID=UPI000468AF7E|nr:hypothetical protein [Caldalkalibacillus mannanilyticus]
MIMLTKEQFQKAEEYMLHYARPLEKSLFEYEYRKGSKEAVLDELRQFQNSDGGFGKGLEPDFRLPDSSPLATTIAFQIFSRIQISKEDQMLVRALEYLLKSYDESLQRWVSVSSNVNNYPHAPWWHVHEEGEHSEFTPTWGNPSAEIIGYFHQYDGTFPNDFLERLKNSAVDVILGYSSEIEMHEILCFLRLVERLEAPHSTTIMEKLKKSLPQVIGKSPDEWENYSATPLTFVHSPNSPLMSVLDHDLIEKNLIYLISKQLDDGSWEPNWEWGQYHESWEQAKIEWKGILTLQNLRILDAFDKIEKKSN